MGRGEVEEGGKRERRRVMEASDGIQPEFGIEVELVQRWVWKCPACETKNEEVGEPVAISKEERREMLGAVDGDVSRLEELGLDGQFVSLPSVVTCEKCDRTFRTSVWSEE